MAIASSLRKALEPALGPLRRALTGCEPEIPRLREALAAPDVRSRLGI